MRQTEPESENALRQDSTAKQTEDAAEDRLVRCRTGRFFWEYGVLREWEKMLAAKETEQELCMVIYELPAQYAPKKKRQLIDAVRKQTGELWLEEELIQEILRQEKEHADRRFPVKKGFEDGRLYDADFFKQPKPFFELTSFRICAETTAWRKHCRQNGGELEALVVWDAEGDGCPDVVSEQQTGEAVDEAVREELSQLLFSLAENVNFFTVISADTEPYRELAERLFAEYGLLVRFLEKPVRGYYYGKAPLVLKTGGQRKIRRDIFPADAKCLDLNATMPKFLDTIARNGYNT